LALDGGEWLTLHPGCTTPGNEPQYPLIGRLDGPHSRSGRFGGEKSIITEGIPTPDLQARSLVALFKPVFVSGKNTSLFDLKWRFTLKYFQGDKLIHTASKRELATADLYTLVNYIFTYKCMGLYVFAAV
jgi:hypothetical protein